LHPQPGNDLTLIGGKKMYIDNAIINLVLGIVLLTTGKKLYWLFVGVVGFIIGLTLVTQYVTLNPAWLVYVVAVGAGIIGALLAAFLQQLAIALVGFIVGGYGALYLTGLLGINAEPTQWMAVIIGGIVGLLLVASLFDWALYILSSWAGSTLVTQSIGLQATVGVVVFFSLFILGIIIQASLFRSRPKKVPAEVKQDLPQEK
jgi:MFS family permease